MMFIKSYVGFRHSPRLILDCEIPPWVCCIMVTFVNGFCHIMRFIIRFCKGLVTWRRLLSATLYYNTPPWLCYILRFISIIFLESFIKNKMFEENLLLLYSLMFNCDGIHWGFCYIVTLLYSTFLNGLVTLQLSWRILFNCNIPLLYIP